METQLVYDLGGEGKQLGLRIRERIVTDSNLQLKVTGLLNTVTGHFGYFASLRKFFGSQPGIASTSWADQQLAKRQARLGAGIYYVSDTEDVLLALSARKYFDLGSDVWLLCKLHASFDTRTQRVEGHGRLQLSKSVFNFTDTQDIRVVVGVNALVTQEGEVTQVVSCTFWSFKQWAEMTWVSWKATGSGV
eukprot:jgi/Botrbrau1/7445/Bobra.0083s0017.2